MRALRRALRVTGVVCAVPVLGLALAAPALADASVSPAQLSFGVVTPGATVAGTTTLESAPAASSLVRATITGAGPLAPHLTTRVEACDEPWVADVCGPGADVLVDAWVPTDERSTMLDVAVPASGTAYLRVGLTLSADAPQGETASVLYVLDLVGDDDPAATPLPVTGVDALATGVAAASLVGLGLVLRSRAVRRRATGGAS